MGEEYAAWEVALDLLPKLSVAGGRGELWRRLDALPNVPSDALVRIGAALPLGSRSGGGRCWCSPSWRS